MSIRTSLDHADPLEEIVFHGQLHGKTMVHLMGGGRSRSHVEIEPVTLRYGVATLRAVYIGDVETEETWRNRGYARRVMTAVLERERGGEAAFAILYGIGGFYQRFGYATLGADFGLALRNPEQGAELPEGWSVRLATEADVHQIEDLYDADAQRGSMRKLRLPDDRVWAKLRALLHGEREGDECRVVEDSEGQVAAYAWLGRGFWPVDHAQERYWPNDFSIGEVVGRDPTAAGAALAACRLWGMEEERRRGKRVGIVHVGASPDGFVTAVGQYHDVYFTRTSWDSAGPQVRMLSALRLLRQIEPELSRHVASLRAPWEGTGTIITDEGAAGAATVVVTPTSVRVAETGGAGGEGVPIHLAQQTLVRLVLGAFSPEHLLARTEPHLQGEAIACLLTLFPQRQPYMYLLDR